MATPPPSLCAQNGKKEFICKWGLEPAPEKIPEYIDSCVPVAHGISLFGSKLSLHSLLLLLHGWSAAT